MKINQPLALNEQGIRENQEDSVWPAVGTATETTRTFVVCDGMGGHESGEVASNAVCTSLGNFVAEHHHGPATPAEFEKAIAGAYDMLDIADRSAEVHHRMGTTLTLLSLTDSEAICAHIGDSRIYQVRPTADGSAEIVYKSSDHSLVNELVKANVITPEEALTHPKKNVITRAMQSIEGRRDAASLRRTNNVAAGDYFLMCTDGVTEAVGDQAICEILADRKVSDEVKLASIKALCLSASHDNFSLYLVPIAEGIKAGMMIEETSELIIPLPGVQSPLATAACDVAGQEVAEALDDEVVAEIQPSVAAPVSRQMNNHVSQPYYKEPVAPVSGQWKKVAIAAIAFIVVGAVAYFVFAPFLSKDDSDQTVNESYESGPRPDLSYPELDESAFSIGDHRQGKKEVVSDSREDRRTEKKQPQDVKLSNAPGRDKPAISAPAQKNVATPDQEGGKSNGKNSANGGSEGGNATVSSQGGSSTPPAITDNTSKAGKNNGTNGVSGGKGGVSIPGPDATGSETPGE